MTTFDRLLTDLRRYDESTPLVFTSPEGEIGAGYHVTELRHSKSTGIDCGGNVEAWQEARLQVLDGDGQEHMKVGKFCDILEKSLSKLPELRDVPLLVEVGHGNKNLTLMSLSTPELHKNRLKLPLDDARAVCKPAQRSKAAIKINQPCCTGNAGSVSGTPCCGSVSTESEACCALRLSSAGDSLMRIWTWAAKQVSLPARMLVIHGFRCKCCKKLCFLRILPCLTLQPLRFF